MKNDELIERLIKMVKQTPNDMVLGKEIRSIFVTELKILDNYSSERNDSGLREEKAS